MGSSSLVHCRAAGDTSTVATRITYTSANRKGEGRQGYKEFIESEEEELLAFVEDLIVAEADEDGAITKEAREPMFIALKTAVDVLTD